MLQRPSRIEESDRRKEDQRGGQPPKPSTGQRLLPVRPRWRSQNRRQGQEFRSRLYHLSLKRSFGFRSRRRFRDASGKHETRRVLPRRYLDSDAVACALAGVIFLKPLSEAVRLDPYNRVLFL